MSKTINYPKVLLATPTAEHKDYCMVEWISHIKKLTYPNLDILIVDNSDNKDYYKKIKKELGNRGKVIHINRKENQRLQDLMRDCNNKTRTAFLKDKDYKFLFSLESDLFPPLNIIEYLIRQRKPFVAAPYFTGQHYTSMPIDYYPERFGNLRQIVPSLIKSFARYDGKLVTGNNTGIGCALIHHKILEDIKFRTNPKEGAFADTYLHSDVYDKWGIEPYLTSNIIVEHKNSDWRKIYKEEETN